MLLNCHSYYSLNYGCLSVEGVLDTALSLGHSSVAITDINNTSETFRFLKLSKEKGIDLSVGIDFRNGVTQQYIGLAKNNDGFFELNQHLSIHSKEEKSFPKRAPEMQNAFIIYPFKPEWKTLLKSLRPDEYVGVTPRDLRQIRFDQYYSQYKHKMVALCTATFRHKRDYNTHRLLRAMGDNTLLSKLNKGSHGDESQVYRDSSEISLIYDSYPKILENTRKLLSQSHIEFDFNSPKGNKRSYAGSQQKDIKLLRELSYLGLPYRYKANEHGAFDPTIIQRLENELKLIESCEFCAYFLINWDLVKYAESQGFPYVGRGSGANSMVAYLLKITNVDPIDLDLYFERFINPYRNSPPDFDIDFSWTDRDAITKYLFDKYGEDKVALLGSYQTYQHKAVVRGLGKVFGLPDEEIRSLQHGGTMPRDEYGKLVMKYSKHIRTEGFPSHLSIHASGIIISEKPISSYTAVHFPPKSYPTTHFDMQVAEDIGLFKHDILSQRGLGKIKDAVELIMLNRRQKIDIDQMDLIKRDRRIKNLLRKGDLTGCFYVESPAMRMLMTKLKAEDYTRLVAASSIIRPGVAKSGMMREYILRFQDKGRREQAKKSLPELYAILEETYGVMVYQEDVIKVAHFFAHLTLAEADILRRGMSWKFRERNEFHKVRQRFFDNCYEKGYPEKTVASIWNQIESFANYAFSKGHSASYAVESFQALYLHAYFPLEYLTATLNNGGGFYSREVYVHVAKMKGAKIAHPCINEGGSLASIKGDTIRLGLAFIHAGFESGSVKLILEEREQNGPYASFRDFVKRLPEISLEQLIILIRAGCFNSLERDKKKLLWDAHFLVNKKPARPIRKAELFEMDAQKWVLPRFEYDVFEDAYDETELFGFPISMGRFDMLESPSELPEFYAKDLPGCIGEVVTIAGYKVHVKATQTSNKKEMYFGTFIDRKGDWIDTVSFINEQSTRFSRAPGCYLITGLVEEEFGHISIRTHQMQRLTTKALIEESA